MKRSWILPPTLVFAATLAYVGTQRVEGKAVEASSNRQTLAVVDAAAGFLTSLSADQRQKVQFAFSPQKLGVNAPFHRTSDGGVAAGAPAAGQGGAGGPGRDSGGPGRDPGSPGEQNRPPNDQGRGPGGSGGQGGRAGSGPPGGFIGEQYGQAVWSNYPVSDVLRPGLRLGTLTVPQRAAAMHLLQTALAPWATRRSSTSWDRTRR